MILQEGTDSTIEQLNEVQQVMFCTTNLFFVFNDGCPQNQGIVDETTNAQIDTLILDNRKKLNQIIGMSLLSMSPAES
jgi:huntingtin-interacting protein 1-related protein